MKFRILLIALFLWSYCAIAQTDERKGNLSAGISGLPILVYSTGLMTSGFALKASFGVYLSGRISLESNLFYYHNDDVLPFLKDAIIGNGYGLQTSMRYHFLIRNKISFFADAGLGFGSIKYSTGSSRIRDVEQDDTGIIIYTGGVGSLIRLSNKFELELLIPYMSVRSTTAYPTNIYGNESLMYSGLVGLSVGFRYNF